MIDPLNRFRPNNSVESLMSGVAPMPQGFKQDPSLYGQPGGNLRMMDSQGPGNPPPPPPPPGPRNIAAPNPTSQVSGRTFQDRNLTAGNQGVSNIPAGGGNFSSPPVHPAPQQQQQATGWQLVGNMLNRLDPTTAASIRQGMMNIPPGGGARWQFIRDALAQAGALVQFLPQDGTQPADWTAWDNATRSAETQPLPYPVPPTPGGENRQSTRRRGTYT